MELIKQYLKWQDFGGPKKEPRYQLLTWVESQLIGPFQTVVIPTDKYANCLFIETSLIQISTDGMGGTISFKDARMNTNLFTIYNSLPIFGINNFNYLIPDSSLTIVSNSATVLFAIAYARITTDKKL